MLFQVRLGAYPLDFSYLVSITTGREGPQSTGPLAVRFLGLTPYMYIQSFVPYYLTPLILIVNRRVCTKCTFGLLIPCSGYWSCLPLI
jgi:hypothetical protein